MKGKVNVMDKTWERKNNGTGRNRTDNLLLTGQLRYHLRHWDGDSLQTLSATNLLNFIFFPKSPRLHYFQLKQIMLFINWRKRPTIYVNLSKWI